MSVQSYLIILFATFSLTVVLTLVIKNYLISRSITVIPDQRSSHKKPKPQGGGISIVISLVISLSVLFHLELIARDQFLFFLIPGLIVAFIGLLDDFQGIKPSLRLFFHFISAFLGLYLIGNFPDISLLGYQLELGLLGFSLGLIYIVWMVNLYNFMDGIDGLASLEALFVLVSFSIISYLVLNDFSFSFILLVISSTVLGFLVFNFPNSQILMGDVGSYFLGLIISLISIYTSLELPELFWSWLILLGIFLVDSTYTLIRRIFLKKKFHLPHSNHAYQKLARVLSSHSKTSIYIFAINLFWLCPLAFLVAFNKIDGFLGTVVAYLPLIFLINYLEAGTREKQEL